MCLRKGLWGLIFLVQGCSGSEEPVTDVPPDKIMRKYKGMGKLFGKELTLFGKAPDREKIMISPYLWQATLDILRFMGIQQVSLEMGLLETAWYSSPEVPAERFKVVATVLGGRVSSEKVRITILSERKNSRGSWESVAASRPLEEKFEEEILLRARFIKSQTVTR